MKVNTRIAKRKKVAVNGANLPVTKSQFQRRKYAVWGSNPFGS